MKDFDRPQSKSLRDAPLMGKKITPLFPRKSKSTSPAKRTKETLELFYHYDQNFSIEFDDAHHGWPINYLEHVINNDSDEALGIYRSQPRNIRMCFAVLSRTYFFPNLWMCRFFNQCSI